MMKENIIRLSFDEYQKIVDLIMITSSLLEEYEKESDRYHAFEKRPNQTPLNAHITFRALKN